MLFRSGFPILSIITWSPFISALIIMAFARHRPLLVRWTGVIGSSISLALSGTSAIVVQRWLPGI